VRFERQERRQLLVRRGVLSLLQVGQAEVEPGLGVLRRLGEDLAEGGLRLVEGAQLVAGDAEAGAGIQTAGIAREGLCEVARRLVVALLAEGRPPLGIRRRAAGQRQEGQEGGKPG